MTTAVDDILQNGCIVLAVAKFTQYDFCFVLRNFFGKSFFALLAAVVFVFGRRWSFRRSETGSNEVRL